MLKIKRCRKVRYHCHYTGEYKGAAHNICDLKYSVAKEIHIVFHCGSKKTHNLFSSKSKRI